MQDYKNLKVWQKAHGLVLSIYTKVPKYKLYGLTSQIRRAGVSIPANIAEGSSRGGDPEFARFLYIAQASASELDYHLLLARNLEFIKSADYERLSETLDHIRRILANFIQTIKSPNKSEKRIAKSE